MKPDLREFLEEQYDLYNRPDFITLDPVSIPHQFTKKEDIEIAGFFAATIAWGQRPTILKNANELMRRMDNAPHDFIQHHLPKDRKQFQNFVHRTFNGVDCMYFLQSLQNIYRKQGSLEQTFTGEDARNAILNFRTTFFSTKHPSRSKKHISLPPLKEDAAGSSCKRLNMFLRWMVRKDKRGVDFGIWNNMKMDQLMCPLDVHSGNVARKLGLLKRKQNDWQAVEELTKSLRKFDPNDPVKYDFALFGMGVNLKKGK